MKKLVPSIVITLLVVIGVATWVSAHAQNAEETAIRQAIENYFRGHSTGQGEYFRKVFHPDSKLFAVRDGKYWQLTSEEDYQ